MSDSDSTEGRPAFLLDVMLGKLRPYLRTCGHDTAYALDRDVEADDRLREIAAEEGRRLLTRDVSLAERTDGALLIESRDVTDQLRELAAAGYELTPTETPEWCGNCNGNVLPVDPDANRPEYVPDGRERVWRCVDCGQHFWKGSHWEQISETLSAVNPRDLPPDHSK